MVFTTKHKKTRVCAYNQNFYCQSCDQNSKCLAKDFDIDFESSTTYDIIEKNLKFRDQHKEIFEKEKNDQFQGYRHSKKM